MKVKVKRSGNEMHVKVTIASKAVNEAHKKYDSSDVVRWLETNEAGFSKDLYELKIQTRSVLHEGLGENYLSGEWVFVKSAQKEPAPKTVPTPPIAEERTQNPRDRLNWPEKTKAKEVKKAVKPAKAATTSKKTTKVTKTKTSTKTKPKQQKN